MIRPHNLTVDHVIAMRDGDPSHPLLREAAESCPQFFEPDFTLTPEGRQFVEDYFS